MKVIIKILCVLSIMSMYACNSDDASCTYNEYINASISVCGYDIELNEYGNISNYTHGGYYTVDGGITYVGDNFRIYMSDSTLMVMKDTVVTTYQK